MTRIEELREIHRRGHKLTCLETAELMQHIDAIEASNTKLREMLQHIGNRSASPWVQKDCQSALAADGERG